MKIRLLLILAGLAIGFALPTFAQQTNTPDPKLREQAESLRKKVDEAINNNNAAAMPSFYTEDAAFVCAGRTDLRSGGNRKILGRHVPEGAFQQPS
jgi:hypothetical protein